jgi:isocitrate/isopropylmalate dehydrogenase
MLLEHLGFADASARLDGAVAAVYAEGRALTPDQGGAATTTQFCESVARALG